MDNLNFKGKLFNNPIKNELVKTEPFKIGQAIYNLISYKGIPFPGVSKKKKLKDESDLGATLRKKDIYGRYYFMPVVLTHKTLECEIPNAVIGYTAKKTIVETPMVGRRGSVKELVNIDDYEISITGAVIGDDWPEAELKKLNDLFKINEPIQLTCALTNLFMDEENSVVIKSMDFVETRGAETIQIVKMTLTTDSSLNLIL